MTSTHLSTASNRLIFLELIERYGCIEIPEIQRDYAHGRTSAIRVRNRFIDSLFDCLCKDKPLSLDFIYGENEEGTFRPIDGQQRLTTLFHLHWALALAAGKLADFQSRMIGSDNKTRFRYRTRPASDHFFTRLLTWKHADPNLPLSEQIRDAVWFFSAWEHDPTVAGSLIVLDQLQQKIRESGDAEALYARLTGTGLCRITLDVLDIGQHGLSDEIYIKMNARGQELTGFEKFKAWLIGRYGNLPWTDSNGASRQWPLLLDNEWLELFWSFHYPQRNQNKGPTEGQHEEDPARAAGSAFFQTLVALATNWHAAHKRFDKTWVKASEVDDESLWEALFTADCLPDVFQNLSALSARKGTDYEINNIQLELTAFVGSRPDFRDTFLQFFDGDTGRTSFKTQLWLHALCVCLNKGILSDGNKRLHWFRVVRNLIANNELDEARFFSLITGINRMAADACASFDHDVLRLLSVAPPDISGADGPQFIQEVLKAQRICAPQDGTRWDAAIRKTESHPVFDGEISLLLTEEVSLPQFEMLSSCFFELIAPGEPENQENEWLLPRAILAVSGNLALDPQNKMLFNGSLANWAQLLNEGSLRRQREFSRETLKVFRKGMVSLLARISGHQEPTESMRQIISEYHGDGSWQSDFVLYAPAMLANSRLRKIQHYYHEGIYVFERTNWSDNDILLGAKAWLRNHIIRKLISASDSVWKIDREGRELSVDENGTSRVMYAGHRIQLNRCLTDPLHEIYCQFDPLLLRLGIKSVDSKDSLTVDYPECGSYSEFKVRVSQLLDSHGIDEGHPLHPALVEILAACEDTHCRQDNHS